MARSKFLNFKFFEARGVLTDHDRAEICYGDKRLYESRALYVGQFIFNNNEPPPYLQTYEVVDEFVIVVN